MMMMMIDDDDDCVSRRVEEFTVSRLSCRSASSMRHSCRSVSTSKRSRQTS